MDEVKRRVGNGLSVLLDEAKQHYQVVAENLKPVAEAFASDTQTLPMPPATDAEGTPAVAAEKLRRAREAESKALAVLEKFVESL